MNIKTIDASKTMEDHFNEKLWDIELNDYKIKCKFAQVEESMNKGFKEISDRVKELKDMVYGNNFTEIGGL